MAITCSAPIRQVSISPNAELPTPARRWRAENTCSSRPLNVKESAARSSSDTRISEASISMALAVAASPATLEQDLSREFHLPAEVRLTRNDSEVRVAARGVRPGKYG